MTHGSRYPATEYTLTATRTMQVLEALAFEPMTVPRLAAGLGMHPRTVCRMMAALNAARYVEQRPTAGRPKHLYTPTLRLLSLAVQLTRHHPVIAEARALVRQLRNETELGAYAAVPTHDQVVVVARSGADAPAAWTVLSAKHRAVGQVLLAHHQRWREQLGAGEYAERAAAMTRHRGYVLGKDPGGLASLAAAVHASGEPEVAIAVTGPAEVLRSSEESLARTVMAAAADVST